MLLIPAALGVAAIAILATRSAPLRVRLTVDILLLAVFSGIFYREGQTPLLLSDRGSALPGDRFDQALAIGWWLLAARVASAVVHFNYGHDRRSRETRLFSDLLSGAVYVGATLIVLDFVLRLPLAGLLATSGVVAIVLGLALQNTLSDVFSGIAVGVEQPFRVGDRVKLGDHVEGIVYQINWRSTRIHTDGDDLAIIPNSAVAKAEIVNRSFPTPRRETKVEILCPASAGPERLDELVANALLLCPAILEKPGPTVHLTRLGMRTSTFGVSFSVADPAGLAGARDALLRQIRRQLLHAGLLTGADGASAPDLLRQTAVFDSLTETQIEGLRERVSVVALAAGETLFEQGTKEANLYVVARGVLEISRIGEGEASRLEGRIGVGEYIGETSLLTGAPHPVTARAITPAVLHVLGKEAIAPLLETEPRLAAAFEASVKRGWALLHRDPAARQGVLVQDEGQLLNRIRSFFRL